MLIITINNRQFKEHLGRLTLKGKQANPQRRIFLVGKTISQDFLGGNTSAFSADIQRRNNVEVSCGQPYYVIQ
jgi:hypothetical protein